MQPKTGLVRSISLPLRRSKRFAHQRIFQAATSLFRLVPTGGAKNWLLPTKQAALLPFSNDLVLTRIDD